MNKLQLLHLLRRPTSSESVKGINHLRHDDVELELGEVADAASASTAGYCDLVAEGVRL
jgi:hypothetical protein